MTTPAGITVELDDRNDIVISIPGMQGPVGPMPTLSSTTPPNTTSSSGTAGVSTEASRRDHRHGFSRGTPVALATAAAPGTASTVASGDHVHPTTGLVTQAAQAIFVGSAMPTSTVPHLWVQTGLGPGGTDFTFWIEDGV